MQILSQGRDLGIVQVLPDDGALKMNAFSENARFLKAFELMTYVDQRPEMERQVTGSAEYWHPTRF